MEFEQWLEAELAQGFSQAGDTPVPSPRYSTFKNHPRRNPVIKVLAALAGSKAALVAITTVALAGAGVGAKAATTGDANPLNWGAQVTQQVQSCKDNLAGGQHGIGQCVSDFAKQHGQAVSGAHSQATGHPTPKSHPTGPPSPFPGHGREHTPGPPWPFPGQGHGAGADR